MLIPRLRREARFFSAALFVVSLAGCGRPEARPAPAPTAADSERVTLSLALIQPVPRLPASAGWAAKSEPDPAAGSHWDVAQDHFEAGRWGAAITAVDETLATDSRPIAPRLLAARACLAQNDLELSEQYLAEALKLDPRSPGAYWLLGETRFRRGQDVEAIQSLRLALAACGGRLDRPECILACFCLATALEREGYLTAAAEQFEAFLAATDHPSKEMLQFRELADAIQSNRRGAFQTLGEIHNRLGHQARAMAVYRRAVEEHPQVVALRIGLSRSLVREGREEEAMNELARLLREQAAAYRAVDSELAAGAYHDRLMQLAGLARRMVQREPDDPAARYLLARLLMLDGQREAASEQLRAALMREDSFAPAAAALAEIKFAERDWESAIESAEKALRLGLQDVALYTLKGRAHDALDQLAEAENAWRAAFELDRRSAASLYLLAESWERRGHRETCEALYKHILEEIDPGHVGAREKLFLLHLNGNQLPEARVALEGFAAHGVSGPVVDRCRAMLNLATSEESEGARRLAGYQAELQEIVERNPGDAATLIALAMSCLAAGGYEHGLEYTGRALDIEPDNLRAREFKATLEHKLLNYEEASRVMEDLIKERPRDLGYQQRFLELAIARADYDRVVMLLQALQAREDLADRRGGITMQLLEALLAAGRFEEAVATAEEWRDEDPADQSRKDVYLATLARAGRHQDAIGLIRQALSDDPTNSRLRSRCIAQLQAAKRHVEAQQQLLYWLGNDPDNIDLNRLLISSFCSAKQWDSAIEVARTGLDLPEHREIYEALLGQSYLLAGRYDEAIEVYRERLANVPTESAYRDLIAALARAGRFTEAEQTVNKLLLPEIAKQEDNRPFDAILIINLRRFLASIYQQMGRPEQAVQQLEIIHGMIPTDPEANNDLGYTWADAGIKLEEARRMVVFAASQRPNEAAYIDSVGWVYYKLGDFKRAVYYLRLAIKKAEDETGVMLDHLGDALYRLGRTDDARGAWERALSVTDEERDRPPDAQDRRVHLRVQEKLEALRRGEKPLVASLASGELTEERALPPPPSSGTANEQTIE